MDRITIPESQVNGKGTVDAESKHQVPLSDTYVPWMQGTKPPWKNDDYAEYAKVGSSYSSFGNDAHRIRVDLKTTFTNIRRYHDWKGYDDISPSAQTVVHFNDIQVGVVRAHPKDILRHLMAVHKYIEDLQQKLPVGWWTGGELNALVGRQVDYDKYPGVIISVDGMNVGEITVYCPTWPDDGYDREGRLRASILYEKINWHPTAKNRPMISPDDPYVGPEYVEENDN